MITENLSNAGFPIVNGDLVRITYSNGSIEERLFHDGIEDIPEVEPAPVIPLSNLEVANAAKVGDIYWVQEGVSMTITGDCDLPDGSLIVMAEQVVDATNAISDTRFKADIANGVVTLTAKFDKSGNYMITASRVNRGLDRIGAGVNLSFDDIEFDVYV